MSESPINVQRKQLDSLMRKNPEIGIFEEVKSEDTHHDKSGEGHKQKRSFDYSNYIRNKKHQLQASRNEQLKQQELEEQEQFESKQAKRKHELEAKTAKKRAARQKKLMKHKATTVKTELNSNSITTSDNID